MRKKPRFDKTKFESFEALKLSPAYIEYRLLADAKKYDQRIREATREYPKGGKYIPAGKNKNIKGVR